jgi:hypothetical protein
MLKRLVKFGSTFIDYKMGFFGAFVMGGVVFAINYNSEDGMSGATTAALKQASYTFFLGGVFMKGCEHLACRIKHQTMAIILSALIPSVVTLILTYNVHKLKGTPKPLESTIPTLIIIPATAIWGYKKRKEYNLEVEKNVNKIS